MFLLIINRFIKLYWEPLTLHCNKWSKIYKKKSGLKTKKLFVWHASRQICCRLQICSNPYEILYINGSVLVKFENSELLSNCTSTGPFMHGSYVGRNNIYVRNVKFHTFCNKLIWGSLILQCIAKYISKYTKNIQIYIKRMS